LNKQQSSPAGEHAAEPVESRENTNPSLGAKKQFVEPVVSVPVDVLEATSFFFQATTIDTSDV
jgi:hypothetical protein